MSKSIEKMPEVPLWVKTNFEQYERALNGEQSSAIHALRKQAYDFFIAKGMPTAKNEDWKYTSLSNLSSGTYKLSQLTPAVSLREEALAAYLITAHKNIRMVFCDGRFSPELSTLIPGKSAIGGVEVKPYKSFLEDYREGPDLNLTIDPKENKFESSQPIIALNTTFFQDGIRITIEQSTKVKEVIQLIFINSDRSDAVFQTPRILIEAAQGCDVNIVESYIGLGKSNSLSMPLTEMIVKENAHVGLHKIILEGEAACLLGNTLVRQDRDSRVSLNLISFSGKLIRNEVRLTLNGANCNSSINGLTVIDEDQHVDNHTVIDHAKPHCESREKIKGIYGDKSKGVFNGTIIVRENAQKTNALQSNQSILLSPDATIDTKPQLKIWADDVKCTHGATVGQIDEDALFYLRSRGLDKKTARDLLIKAFASDVITEIENEPLRTYLSALLEKRLETLN